MTIKTVELIILRGLPGSGKSTRAADYPDHLHYEPDHFFSDTRGKYRFDSQLWGKACEWTLVMADFALARGESVVVSDVFSKAGSLAPYKDIATAHGAKILVKTCDGDYGNSHRVPLFIYNQMKGEFDVIDEFS